MFTPEERADGVIFDAAREAGFEDGVDFRVAEGAASMSPRMRTWFQQKHVELTLKAFHAWQDIPYPQGDK